MAFQGNVKKIVATDRRVFKSFKAYMIILAPLVIFPHRRRSPATAGHKMKEGYFFCGVEVSAVCMIVVVCMRLVDSFVCNLIFSNQSAATVENTFVFFSVVMIVCILLLLL